jgi:predicted dehydrogenase
LIVGLGQIGMGYDLGLDPEVNIRTHARAFSRHPSFRLLGAADPEAARRETFEREYRCPAFSDVEAALRSVQPELVVISAPTPLHAAVLAKVLALSRPKAVLCEKPLSYDLAEARAMVKACADKGVRLFVNYMRRSDPGAIEIKRRLDSGEIKTPVKGVVWYSKGLMHNGSHFFNLLEYWLGEMKSADIVGAGRLWDGVDPEPDVNVVFARGQAIFLAAREEDYSHYTVELVAPNGRLRYDKGGRRIVWQSAVPDKTFAGYVSLSDEPEPIESQMDRFQYNVAEQIAARLEGHDACLSDGADALRTLESLTTIKGKI